MATVIRRATAADYTAIVGLFHELGAELTFEILRLSAALDHS